MRLDIYIIKLVEGDMNRMEPWQETNFRQCEVGNFNAWSRNKMSI